MQMKEIMNKKKGEGPADAEVRGLHRFCGWDSFLSHASELVHQRLDSALASHSGSSPIPSLPTSRHTSLPNYPLISVPPFPGCRQICPRTGGFPEAGQTPPAQPVRLTHSAWPETRFGRWGVFLTPLPPALRLAVAATSRPRGTPTTRPGKQKWPRKPRSHRGSTVGWNFLRGQ